MRCIARWRRCWPPSRANPPGGSPRYALGSDYHVALRRRLEGLANGPARCRAAGGLDRLRRRSAIGRTSAGRTGRAGLDRQEHEPVDPRSRRIVGIPGGHPELGRAAGGRAGPHHLRQLHSLPVRLPDRCAGGAPDNRCTALHQLPDHRASRRAGRVGVARHRRLDLRLRRVSGGVPGQRRGAGRRPAARAAPAAGRVAAAPGHACLRPRGGGDGADAGRPASAPAQCAGRARERGPHAGWRSRAPAPGIDGSPPGGPPAGGPRARGL